MCRVWGYSLGANDEVATPSQIARVLFPLLTKRGPHAYGWMTADGTTESKVRTAKFAGRADTELASERFGKIDQEARVMIAHTRYATLGSPLNMNNNHPMRHGNIVGVHNGVLRNHDEILAKTGRFRRNTQVDSEAIFAAVNRWGHKKGLAKIDGDMVAVYTDLRKPHVVSIARSHGRSCVIGRTEANNLFWASEKSALEALSEIGIEFNWFSGVRDYRLITIRGGRIINRLTYYTPPAIPARVQYSLPRGRVIERRESQGRTSAINEYFDAIKNGGNPDKYRREALVEMRQRDARDSIRRKIDADEFITSHVESDIPIPMDNNLYYLDGLYLTATEYADAMNRKEGWA